MQEKNTLSFSEPRDTSKRNKLIALGAALAVAGVGFTLFLTRAAGPFVATEPELGSLTSPAAIGQDANTSGGKFVTFGSGSPSVAGTTYYVDCNGNDSNNGTAENAAWKTLGKASAASVKAGDAVLLKRGCTFNGTLRTGPSGAPWKGTASSPITLSAYGTGAMPIISNNVDNSENIDVTGSYITIDGLSLKGIAPGVEAGCQNTPKGYILGVAFESGATGNLLTNSSLTGFYAGVYVLSGASGNRVLRNNFVKNDMMMPVDRAADNDAGAFGILLWGDNTEIGYNTINDNNACSYDYGRDGSAIEVYGGRGNVIHHNTAINDDAFAELGDPRSANNSFIYNLYSSTSPTSVFLIARGASTDLGPTSGTKVYNNTAYLTGDQSQGVVCYGGCTSGILSLKNNIVWVGWKALYADGAFDESHNIYWKVGGSPLIQASSALSNTSKQQDPKFVATGSDFHLAAGSPAIDAGDATAAQLGYTTDLDSKNVPAGASADIGTFESGASAGAGNCTAVDTALGSVNTTVTVPSSGTYKIWSRVKAADATNNSYWLVVDNECPVNVGDSTSITTGSWTWTNTKDGGQTPISLTLAAGSHSLKLYGREKGVALDRIMLLSDECIPSGLGDNCTATTDTTPPTITLLTPTANQSISGSFTVSVNASDNSGGSGIARVEYYLDASPAPLAAPTASPYSFAWNTASAGVGPHTITAYAFDKSGNKSAAASVAVTVIDTSDTSSPSVPAGLQAGTVTTTSASLSWAASTDNKGVAGYHIYRDNQFKATSTTLSYTDTSLSANTRYDYTVSAFDAAGNESGRSTVLTVTTKTATDTTPPSAPSNLKATAASATRVNLTWNASTDSSSGVAKYLIQRNGTIVAEATTTSFADTGVLPNTTYSYAVYAVDGAGNTSAASSFQSVKTPSTPDTQAPSAPTELQATSVKSRQVMLSWTAATDNTGVAGYKVYRGDTQISTTQSLTFGDATVKSSTTYSYRIVAFDAAGNASDASNTVTITTPAATVARTLKFEPTADAYISRNSPNRNFGSSGSLKVDGNPQERALLKFTVNGTSGKRVIDAKLRLYVNRGSQASGGNFYALADNNWNERDLKWNNSQNFGANRLGGLGRARTGTWIEMDVSKFIKGDGVYSLGINSSNGDGVYYNSKESRSNRPQLILTTE